MGLEGTFRELSGQIYNLLDSWEFLDVTVRDQPEDEGAALADALDGTVLDLIGLLLQARKAALSARQAVTHRSFGTPHNERLEYLGDSLLNCAVATLLYDKFPKLPEGDLSRLRASLSCESSDS